MKKTGLLNQPLSAAIAGMGHGDKIIICDAGLPIPAGVQRIDLAVQEGIPSFLDVLDATLGELEVERAIIAQEMQTESADLHGTLQNKLASIEIDTISHESFKQMSAGATAIVRTGEFTPYANVILVAGVVF
jgi:D-ribose pyranase